MPLDVPTCPPEDKVETNDKILICRLENKLWAKHLADFLET